MLWNAVYFHLDILLLLLDINKQIKGNFRKTKVQDRGNGTWPFLLTYLRPEIDLTPIPRLTKKYNRFNSEQFSF